MIDKKTNDLADAEERAATARTDLDDTQNVLAADTEFLAKLKEQCKLHQAEYAARVNDRIQETAACQKALDIVSHDDAKRIFQKALGSTKRPEGGKLGSRNLKEFKEERESQSMRSQTNKARKKQWGTDDRYLFMQMGSKLLPRASKLADIAKRTQNYWAAKIYEEHQGNTTKAAALAKMMGKVHKVDKPPTKKLGLTAEQTKAKGRKDAMQIVTKGVERMMSELEKQQGEETARKDWCVDEIHAVEKKIDINARLIADLKEHIERLEYLLTEGKEELKQLIYDLEDARIEVQKGSNDRRKADKVFQKTVMDQKETKLLLQGTLTILKQFYDRKKKASLLRTATSASAAKLSVVADEVKSVAKAWVDGANPLNFGNAQSSAMHGVVAAGEAGLKARAMELKKEAAHPDAALVKEKAVVQKKGEDDFKVNPNAIANFMDAWGKVPFRRSASLLQSEKKGMTPSAGAAKLMKEAESSHADAQKIIAQAKEIASKNAPKAMLQQPAGPPPPPGFKKKKDSAMSGGVTVMLNNMIDDVDAMIEEAVKDETSALEAYEVFMQESNAMLTEMKNHITSLQEMIAKAEEEKLLKEQELDDADSERKILRQQDIDLWGVEGCKYLLENFDLRKQERKEEIESLDTSLTTLGAGGGDPKVAAIMDPKAEHVPSVEETPGLPELEEPEDEEEEQEDAPSQPPSEFHTVPEGVEIVGPNGETAISKMPR